MPRPEGDRLSFAFPFTVSADQIGGILAFVAEHFNAHGDASLGAFAAARTAITEVARGEGGRSLALKAEIALAPFDLGVVQRLTLSTRPSDIAGIDEVMVELERTSGAAGTWLRSNRGFIGDLRQQFLLWRSLPLETVQHYHAEAARLLAPAAPEGAGARRHG
jgi:hypothetical protein